MREHRYGARGQTFEGDNFVDDTPRSIPISRRETTIGRRRRAFAHLGPISIEASIEPVAVSGEVPNQLPVANRNSA
jgi:hypothetical protein